MDLVDLVECADFAARKHKDQRRKNAAATPYINHPIGVARILAKEADVTDLATLQAALLHDTVEDTDTTFDEIEKLFGKEVRDIVADVTDDKSLPKMERKRRQVEHAPHCSPKAKLVKLADKLYNLRDLDREAGLDPGEGPGVLPVGLTGGPGSPRVQPGHGEETGRAF